ncbi:MAG: Asp-tRNA(Asn)/Glu-tRNA(Gln) amidotransferase subunit GatB [Candidatus Vogelbacteria bacterium]|nr:Asp-tRNA(Asn)/Glu-tRNA(Gln) amidotransferase subunit GatB [Candidatus Vogelbacteria bacterium]
MAYTPTIGLEIHAELATKTKLFCNSKNDPDERRPNVNICPVCMGHPGTLPVLNKEAVRQVIRVGTAIGGTIADFTEFDRKNYFYPDIPKGYQITQYAYPLVVGGELQDVSITRVHLEEDTARSQHGERGESLLDFNRAGVPLMELVTEPVIRSAEEASAFARELQLLLRYLGASEANMDKGEMRVEANISISKDGARGTKVEIKNLNSFRAVERAIAYEMERQERILESGEKVAQETRGWDEGKQKTFSQRVKESSHDYRYFPDPDVPKLKISEVAEFQNIAATLPELPSDKRARLGEKFGLATKMAEYFVGDALACAFFEESIAPFEEDAKKIMLAANYLVSDVAGLMQKKGDGYSSLKFTPLDFASLVEMIHRREISSRGAKDILAAMYARGGKPESLARELHLYQRSNRDELVELAKKLIAEDPKIAAEYRAGKTQAIQFFIGRGMKETKGSANPQLLKEVFEEALQ